MWDVCGVENVMCGMFVAWRMGCLWCGQCDVWDVCGVDNVMCGMFVVWRM